VSGQIVVRRRNVKACTIATHTPIIAANAALAIGAALIEAFGWRDVTPGAVAAVVLPMGIGELIFFYPSQRGSAGLHS
jgi:hypothetical protein